MKTLSELKTKMNNIYDEYINNLDNPMYSKEELNSLYSRFEVLLNKLEELSLPVYTLARYELCLN